MTAVIRLALLRFAASIITNNSIRLSFTGVLVLCIMKTSSPRTFSKNSTLLSPSAKVLISAGTRVAKQCDAISSASTKLLLPDIIFMFGFLPLIVGILFLFVQLRVSLLQVFVVQS